MLLLAETLPYKKLIEDQSEVKTAANPAILSVIRVCREA
jgi:hypothetical protein